MNADGDITGLVFDGNLASLGGRYVYEADVNRTVAVHAAANHVELKISGEAFLTEPGPLSSLVADAIAQVTGQSPDLSTTGGTSDARFIRRLCPVVEFGLPGLSMHKVDEQAAVADVEGLTAIYAAVLARALPF